MWTRINFVLLYKYLCSQRTGERYHLTIKTPCKCHHTVSMYLMAASNKDVQTSGTIWFLYLPSTVTISRSWCSWHWYTCSHLCPLDMGVWANLELKGQVTMVNPVHTMHVRSAGTPRQNHFNNLNLINDSSETTRLTNQQEPATSSYPFLC